MENEKRLLSRTKKLASLFKAVERVVAFSAPQLLPIIERAKSKVVDWSKGTKDTPTLKSQSEDGTFREHPDQAVVESERDRSAAKEEIVPPSEGQPEQIKSIEEQQLDISQTAPQGQPDLVVEVLPVAKQVNGELTEVTAPKASKKGVLTLLQGGIKAPVDIEAFRPRKRAGDKKLATYQPSPNGGGDKAS